jgi:molybdate/tungstate transport system substrate-binding protein
MAAISRRARLIVERIGRAVGNKSRERGRRPIALYLPLLFVAASCLAQMQAAQAAGTVNVLYAGSLVNLMERSVGPAFQTASGDRFQGFAGGSKLLANQIKGKLRQGDVFISAVPQVNNSLMGPDNGGWVSWYIAFAQSPLVIGYNAQSRFATDFKSKPWYQVLMEPGIRIGRTEPKLDPKGALTIALMKKAEAFYKTPDLSQRVLGAPDNPAEVLPEETLVGRLQSGQLDAGFFYSTETADAKIPAIQLPAEITPKAVYTVTVLNRAANPDGAANFAAFLLGPDGQGLMKAHGMDLRPLALAGPAAAVPAPIAALLNKGK